MSLILWLLACFVVFVARNENLEDKYKYPTIVVVILIIVGYIVSSAL